MNALHEKSPAAMMFCLGMSAMLAENAGGAQFILAVNLLDSLSHRSVRLDNPPVADHL